MQGSCRANALLRVIPGLARAAPRNDTEFAAPLSASLRAKRSNPESRAEPWIASAQGRLAMTWRDIRSPSRGASAPELCCSFAPLNTEGAGKTGSSPPPWPPCERNARGRNHRFGWDIPAFPARWLYGLLRALPRDRLSCPCHQRHRRRELDLSTGRSGPHGLIVRIKPFVGTIARAAVRYAHRIPHPTFVTTAIRPSDRGGTSGVNIKF